MTRTVALDQLHYADFLRPHDVVGWPQGPGEPLALTRRLIEQRDGLVRPTLLFGMTTSDTLRPELASHFGLRALNGAGNNRRVTHLAEIVPCHISSIPGLFDERLLKIDVALVQVRPMPDGRYTFGVISDFPEAMVRAARVVIALLNPSLPATSGDACIDAEHIDLLVDSDDAMIDMPDPVPTATERAVAQRVASLIPDRATVQLGIGTMPTAVAHALDQHRELGVHSGVVSDSLVELVERGVVTNAYKTLDAGRCVTGGLFGTRRLRDFAHASGLVSMRNARYTHDLTVTSKLANYYTINAAVEVDLSGQVNAEVAGSRYLGAVGGQVDFVRAGVASRGGRSIMAFPSVTPDGAHSRITASLRGHPVTTARSDVDMVVTEFGMAELRGGSLNERARRLIAIAHPDHQERLEREFAEGNGQRTVKRETQVTG
ncbi:acetyl-CoA hydrolase/transferase C-terminal domain-containing protein [Caballeronia sp. LZ035]|uniref:acetyl-CoA hydrolase/transferase family protein n=1 Tax=Caballeronia sp. LZ035 TaxID=3038568 RepID=UPI00285ABC8B|nr:acetyl-CoA hydrolase/transferase C-terminal domain-containing protein [Caballeronia sp. LZ035]MDR5760558.1 acetyl-CoA hydrolase/transferase C-terminal domain-containing protein [Caballeronia sp. LZ035]